MDHFQSLTIFTAVADEEGFAAAARSLGLSPPVVTRAVQSLEDRLGARLFDRTTRSVSLTETGRGYYADCQRILGDLAEADHRAAGLHSIPQGRVTVTASSLFGRKIVTPALLGLLDVYPDISISTLFVDRVVHLQDEGLDVAVRIAQLPDSSLMAVRVGAVRRVLVASPDYLDRMGRPQTPDDLAAHDLIHFSSSMDTAGWPCSAMASRCWSRSPPGCTRTQQTSPLRQLAQGAGSRAFCPIRRRMKLLQDCWNRFWVTTTHLMCLLTSSTRKRTMFRPVFAPSLIILWESCAACQC